jgi:hypothetical protein
MYSTRFNGHPKNKGDQDQIEEKKFLMALGRDV